VNVGLQKEGKYAVIVRNEYGVLAEKKLTVKEATTDSPDDFVYAPVDSIVMERPDGVSPRIGLYGTYPLMLKGCMVIREIRHQVTEGDVVVIQPITAIATGKECDDQKLSREFYKSIVLNEVPLQPAREYLIHVRVLGNERHSLNKVAPLGL
jgi:hypothetical protein